MMEYYADQHFNFNDKIYTPTTDVIHEHEDKIYSNEVKDSEGNLHRAYYTQNDYDDDKWDEPFGMWEISKEELNMRVVRK